MRTKWDECVKLFQHWPILTEGIFSLTLRLGIVAWSGDLWLLMGHHGKTTQEDTDCKDSEAPVMWFPLETGSRNTTTLPSTLVWWTKWKFQICLKGSMFWVGDGSLGYQSLADFLGNCVTALGRRFCGWKKLQGFLNGLGNILSHLVKCSIIFRYLSMRIVRWPSKFGATVLTSPSRKVARLPRLSAQREVGELMKLPSNLVSDCDGRTGKELWFYEEICQWCPIDAILPIQSCCRLFSLLCRAWTL